MPLVTPILDSRTWEDLRAELVARIPVYNPEWTDHHASDPAITLLELAAFLAENTLFKFNQLPETAKLAFLSLLDVPLDPPRPASTLVELATTVSDGPLVPIGSRLTGAGVLFESSDEVRVWPVRLHAAVKRNTPRPTDPELLDFVERTEHRLALAVGQTPAYYTTRFSTQDLADPGLAILDTEHTPDRTLWIAVVGDTGTALDTARGELLNVGFAPTDETPALDDLDPCPGLGPLGTVPCVRWQISTGELRDGQPIYADLEVGHDTTEGLTCAGVVRVRLPAATSPLGVFPTDPDVDGAADRPPLVAGQDIEGTVLCWLRVDRGTSAESLGRIQRVGANAVTVVARQSAVAEELGQGDGDADQHFTLAHRDPLLDTLDVQVEENGRWVSYELVEQFLPVAADSREVRVDAEAGTVTFGRPPHQRVPQIGERIRVGAYKWGGGAAGNIPAGSIDSVETGRPVTVAQPLDAAGGADREDVEAGIQRASTTIRRRNRAVAASDFDELARRSDPRVARAETLPLFRPSERGTQVPGAVTVVVWPRRDPEHPGAPQPSRSLLRRVCAYLDQRRLVTTELYVVPPSYVPLAVSVGIAVKPGYGIDAVRRWVELVLRQYLAPVPPYGPDGNGWPLGRRVLAAELEAAALQVEGLHFLTGLQLAQLDKDGTAGSPTDQVLIADWEVPELADITVVEGPPLTPGDRPVEPSDHVPVPVPEITEEC